MVELVFMMLVLKLPIVYLGLVCWWAIRAEPKPEEPALLGVAPDPGPPWTPPSRVPRRPRGPHGRPERSYARTRRAARALP
ncbi:MAG TPA: hypothetical protein VFL41_02060 [Gaiellaceae bacterium]|nr:hypothetical protein [Gaiellaceae bacterium]